MSGCRTRGPLPTSPPIVRPMWPIWRHAATPPTASWRRPSMPANATYDYAIIRVVPYIDRGEFINAGVVLFCRTKRFLAAAIDLDE
ncbi:MAG: DUF3037 domain-containing protein, partial [Caldilineaceae bacterium]|nr:DUF3037 domain-containing protein [Caldilineaceae bacterium]